MRSLLSRLNRLAAIGVATLPVIAAAWHDAAERQPATPASAAEVELAASELVAGVPRWPLRGRQQAWWDLYRCLSLQQMLAERAAEAGERQAAYVHYLAEVHARATRRAGCDGIDADAASLYGLVRAAADAGEVEARLLFWQVGKPYALPAGRDAPRRARALADHLQIATAYAVAAVRDGAAPEGLMALTHMFLDAHFSLPPAGGGAQSRPRYAALAVEFYGRALSAWPGSAAARDDGERGLSADPTRLAALMERAAAEVPGADAGGAALRAWSRAAAAALIDGADPRSILDRANEE